VASRQKYAFYVNVRTAFLPDQSNAEDESYAFSYTITITNVGEVAAQLISRHWVITDANGATKEVKGLGVVGAQPLLEPGEQFEYTSGTLLNTTAGSMHGTYHIVAVDGTQFEAHIEPFILAVPRALH
jgi:ApaG protein